MKSSPGATNGTAESPLTDICVIGYRTKETALALNALLAAVNELDAIATNFSNGSGAFE